MKIPYRIVLGFMLAAFLAWVSRPVLAAGADEATGVQSRKGTESPASGFSAGETNSRINDYIYQDEQINIDGGKDSTVKVLRVNQKNLVNDFVVGVFPITKATPKEIRELFRLITAKEGGRAEVIQDKVGKKAYLQVICPKFQLPYIEETLKAVDESWVKEDIDGSRQYYYRAKFRSVTGIDTIATIVGGGDGLISSVDSTANAIFKRGEPSRMQKWADMAKEIDFFAPQIVLEAAVYEVELTDDLKLGLDYVAWKNGPGSNLFRFATWAFNSRQEAENVTSVFDPFIGQRIPVGGTQTLTAAGHGSYSAFNFLLSSDFIDFLVRNGKARVVTRGRLNIEHAVSGTLAMTDEVIHFVDASSTVASPASDLVAYKRTKNQVGNDLTVGFTFTATPYIGLETTELVYSLSANDVVGTTPTGAPIVRSDATSGTVLLHDGVTACLGGLKRTEDVKSTAKMPILGSIPVLGWLFGGEQNSKRQTEMVVVLTPRMVLFSDIDKELAKPEDNLLRDRVRGKAPIPMLKTQFGFDQWLLGKS